MVIRRFALAAVAVVGAVGLAACGSSAGPGDTSAGPAPAGAITSIFFANPLPAYPDWGAADKCFKDETARLGIKGVTQGPTGLQANDQFVLDRISQSIAQSYDALIAVPITPSAYEPLFQRAKKDGMRIATLNTGDATTTQDFTIGTDYGVQGKQVATEIGKRPGQQVVGIITNQTGGIGDTIINAFKAGLPANVSVAAVAFDAADPAKTADVTSQMLTAHPDINVVFSWEGTAVAGISTAIKEKNATGRIVGVVNDLTPQVVDGIRSGVLYGTSRQHFCDMAKQAVDKLVDVAGGKPVAPATDTGTTFVTKDNLDSVLAEANAQK